MPEQRWCLKCGSKEGECDCNAEFTTNMDRAYILYMEKVRKQKEEKDEK